MMGWHLGDLICNVCGHKYEVMHYMGMGLDTSCPNCRPKPQPVYEVEIKVRANK